MSTNAGPGVTSITTPPRKIVNPATMNRSRTARGRFRCCSRCSRSRLTKSGTCESSRSSRSPRCSAAIAAQASCLRASPGAIVRRRRRARCDLHARTAREPGRARDSAPRGQTTATLRAPLPGTRTSSATGCRGRPTRRAPRCPDTRGARIARSPAGTRDAHAGAAARARVDAHAQRRLRAPAAVACDDLRAAAVDASPPMSTDFVAPAVRGERSP